MSRLWRASPLTYLALVAAAALSIFPIWWMFVVASRSSDAMGQLPPPITPGGNLGANIARLFDNTDAYFLTGLINSVIVATTVTVSVVFFSSLAGFAFAKLRFRGRNALLLVIIATMMVPTQLGVIPLYLLMTRLHWNDRLPAVIVPVLVTGFGVFMMRQYAGQAISDELIEAARMDGCGTARTWWHVVLPALRPAAAVLGLLTFMTTWNDFLWPYAVLNDPANPTVQLSLRALSDGYYQDMSQVFTGTAIATLPLLLVFVLFGRQIIGGIMEGAVKA
ncbi:carbohydrate ABC transporter permease [Micromonospora sp. ALFpr18c]|uniref:carbohydrate ABC transporter permease n=1 Tax=unclassified Micromonospora TaxID=2617518 RepID=UPI00124B210C|nr:MULTISPECIES: carbohydrate ABC transporter permease [unclassified Micromonospora]KAB1947049.1 carbohydrate ABC transporter permease [Micromonospora sp. ALFpr18c]MDG4761774.1 carbohydrate ABC transporter permease [Micromonospora sp. WMMD710]